LNTRKLSLNNTQKAFLAKDNTELKKVYWMFWLMGHTFLVRLFSRLTLLALHIKLPITGLIRKTVFKQFCGGETLDESQVVVSKLNKFHIGSILDYSIEGKGSCADFERTKNEIIRIIKLAKGNKAIPYTCLKMTGIARYALLEALNNGKEVCNEEKQEMEELYGRLNTICCEAVKNEVPVYIDAEESWIQGTIDGITEVLMEKYNTKMAIVQTTLQMYRKDRIDYLHKLIQKATTRNYLIGVKLVRGAYLERENQRALDLGIGSPIQTNKAATDQAFDEAVTICLNHIPRVTLCAGTHNEASTQYLVNEMKRLGIEKEDPHVYFSQLYGMSDNITYNLAAEGYNVTKYLPYGPVGSVLPYLIRRANENTAIAGQMSRELELIVKERKRRETQYLLETVETEDFIH
jgi:proline dehydrogenase